MYKIINKLRSSKREVKKVFNMLKNENLLFCNFKNF